MVAPKVGVAGALSQNNRHSNAKKNQTVRKKPVDAKPSKHEEKKAVEVPDEEEKEKKKKRKKKGKKKKQEGSQEDESSSEDDEIVDFDYAKHLDARRCHEVDWDDRFLTWEASDNKRPRFHEEYLSGYNCFQNCEIDDPQLDVKAVNRCLMDFVGDVLPTVEYNKLSSLPLSASSSCRRTAPTGNVCFNPLQAIRAWGLLANLASNKTLDDLVGFIEKYTGAGIESVDELNKELLNLHVTAEQDFDGAVRLFAEIPHHMPHSVNRRRGCDMIYGGKSQRAAVQHHAFSTDSDGLYSCHRINQEMKLSTKGSIQYVVPESAAPNWRASIALASGMECSFHWKTDEKVKETEEMRFHCPMYGESQCSGIYGLATYEISKNKKMFKLHGIIQGVSLYIMLENKEDVASEVKSITREMWALMTGTNYETETNKLFVPKCTTSTPISLYKHAKKHGLKRLFSSEKSELHITDTEGPANFITLFDHYHKTNFEIVATRPMSPDATGFDEFAPDRAHQCVEKNSLFREYQLGENYLPSKMMFTYFEHYLTPNVASMMREPAQVQSGEKNDRVIDQPFYYVMTRTLLNEDRNEIILCAGYFNNTIWVNDV